MTHPDTLQIPRAVEPEWGPQQAYAEGRSAYENSMLPNTTSAVRFNELSSSEQAFWVAHAAFRAALQPQDAVTTSGPPERDNSKPAEQQGVFRKFNVQRTDGSDQPGGKHHGCEYFVLDVAHDQHAKPALEAYAVACATTHPKLSADMRERYGLQPQATVPKEYSWECNECGAQEYSMSVSEHDVHRLGCGKCGSSEWHKAEVRK